MKTIVYALIKKSDKILILKRPADKKNYALYWNFPGGGLEDGETFEECVIREVMEETGITFKPNKKIYDEMWTNENVRVIVFNGEINTFDVTLCEEHTEFAYLNPHDINLLKTIPYIKKLLKIS